MLILILPLILFSLHLAYKHLRYKNLSLTISVSRRKLFEGEQVALTQTITNAKLLPLPLVEVNFLTRAFVTEENDPESHSFTASLGAYRRVTQKVNYTCVKRGFYRLDSYKLHTCDLLISHWQTQSIACAETITVYPRMATPDASAKEAVSALSLLPDNFYIKGIREYRPQDDIRDINHAASAHAGQLMTNEYESIGVKEICMVLNLRDYSSVRDNPLNEEMIRLAAFFANKLTGKGGVALSFITNGRDVETRTEIFVSPGSSKAHEFKILEALARINLLLDARPITETLRAVARPCIPDKQNKTFLLISREDGADTRAWFESVKPNGRWVMP